MKSGSPNLRADLAEMPQGFVAVQLYQPLELEASLWITCGISLLSQHSNPYPLLINGPPPPPPNNKIRNFGNAFFLLGGCFRVALSVVINYVA